MTIEELDALTTTIADVVKERIAAIEAPLLARIKALEAQQAIPGPVGPQGPAGERGSDGVGVPGRDGRDAAPAVPGEKGADGINGKDGLDGKDGADGLGVDDLDVEHDGERAFDFSWTRSNGVKVLRSFTVPAVIYRGVFATGREYVKGDSVTWGGSMWVAKDATSAKPGEGATAWTLAVKEGRKGDEGKVGKQGEVGPRGEKGETVAKW